MYELLGRFASRPQPHSLLTTKALWTRPHIARRMLEYHLDPASHLASRPEVEIREIVDWLNDRLDLAGKHLCDLGCGPGLYAARFAELGAIVTGVDFSQVSIEYAKAQQSTDDGHLEYVVADYLNDPIDGDFDVATLIYYDFCALSPSDRSKLLSKIHAMLKSGGVVVLDVLTESAFAGMGEELSIEENLMDGFWSDSDYVGIHRKWVYSDLALTLDHYGIVERDNHFEILNWMQYFSVDRLVRELGDAGFSVTSMHESLSGRPLADQSVEIGVIAEKTRDPRKERP